MGEISPLVTMNNARHTTRRLLLASVFAVFLLLSPILVSPALADLTADPGGPYQGIVGENVHFQATAFTDGGRIVEYRWDFGDGTTDQPPRTDRQPQIPIRRYLHA